jgi:Zierdtviridae DNA helicase
MRAVVTRVEGPRGGRIHLWTSRPVRRLGDFIPGAYWSQRKGVWTLPCSMDHCRALRERFGTELEIRPALAEWARAEVAREHSQTALGSSFDAVPLERVPATYPALAKRLGNRPYQLPAVRFLVDGRYIINADTTGLGKTTETIAGIVESGVPGPYLVVCPQTSIDSVWEREILELLPDATVVPVGLDNNSAAKRASLLEEALLTPGVDQDNLWVLVNTAMLTTQTWWICPTCKAIATPVIKAAHDFWLAVADAPLTTQMLFAGAFLRLIVRVSATGYWKATDHPRAHIVDCGHNPARVKVEQEHRFWQLFAGSWGAIIVDELQDLLIRRSGTPTLVRNGARLLRLRQDGLRVALSATPMRGRTHQLWGTLNWLRPDVYTSYWNWVQLYWNVMEGYGGSKVLGEMRDDRRGALDKSLYSIMIRRTKQEVRGDLPPKSYGGTLLDPADPDSPRAVWLEMLPQQRRAYDEMLKKGFAEIDGGRLDAIGGLAELTRMKQFASAYGRLEGTQYKPCLPSNKWDWFVQFLREHNILDPDPTEPAGKVVVVSQWTEMLKLWADSLQELKMNNTERGKRERVRWTAVTGKVSGARRTEAQDIFNDPNSGVNVMFLQTKTGGISITLDAADDMVFIDETHVSDDQEQAEGRIDNRRPEEKIAIRTYWYLKSVGTVEEAIARVNMEWDKQMKGLLDGRRGVAYVRAVLDEMRRFDAR